MSAEDVYGAISNTKRAQLIEEHLQATMQRAKTLLSGPRDLDPALRVDLALSELEEAIPRLMWLGWKPAPRRRRPTRAVRR
jgi:hypothetical protein